MSIDNPGNFLDADNFSDNNNKSDSWKPVKINGNALFKKAIDILNITKTIGDLLPDDADNFASTKNLMMQNATIIPGKIKAALAVDVYSLMMENAVIIKVNMMELKDQLWACEYIENIEVKYLKVLEQEIDVFKKIFVAWVTSFDKASDLPDEWHLFNDPASFPQDDEPFDASDFFDNPDAGDED